MKKKLIIRLQKTGKIKRPFFNIVVTYAHKSSKSGFLQKIGFYNVFSEKLLKNINTLIIDKKLLNYWIIKGAILDLKLKKLLLNYVY